MKNNKWMYAMIKENSNSPEDKIYIGKDAACLWGLRFLRDGYFINYYPFENRKKVEEDLANFKLNDLTNEDFFVIDSNNKKHFASCLWLYAVYNTLARFDFDFCNFKNAFSNFSEFEADLLNCLDTLKQIQKVHFTYELLGFKNNILLINNKNKIFNLSSISLETLEKNILDEIAIVQAMPSGRQTPRRFNKNCLNDLTLYIRSLMLKLLFYLHTTKPLKHLFYCMDRTFLNIDFAINNAINNNNLQEYGKIAKGLFSHWEGNDNSLSITNTSATNPNFFIDLANNIKEEQTIKNKELDINNIGNSKYLLKELQESCQFEIIDRFTFIDIKSTVIQQYKEELEELGTDSKVDDDWTFSIWEKRIKLPQMFYVNLPNNKNSANKLFLDDLRNKKINENDPYLFRGLEKVNDKTLAPIYTIDLKNKELLANLYKQYLTSIKARTASNLLVGNNIDKNVFYQYAVFNENKLSQENQACKDEDNLYINKMSFKNRFRR